MTRRGLVALVGAAIVVLALFLVLRPGDDGGTPSPSPSPSATDSAAPSPSATSTSTPSPSPAFDGEVIEVFIADGTVSAPDEISIAVGTTVRLVVESDVDEEVHVHGYDLYFDVVAGEVTTFDFVADAAGIFEVELHGSGLPLFLFAVEP